MSPTSGLVYPQQDFTNSPKMKFTILSTFLVAALGTTAQTVSFVAPPFDSAVTAGVPFTVTLAFQDVVALFFGAQVGGDPSNQELGGKPDVVVAPKFNIPGRTAPMMNITLTIPVGESGPINITCGEFYTLGGLKQAVNTAFVDVVKTRVMVS
ncbi:hypothetical protein K439DRAFT_1615279 [Ramaria rubella]|nr:hypothetical protein K439DRAFT_1615279 [Ramaria rubella]